MLFKGLFTWRKITWLGESENAILISSRLTCQPKQACGRLDTQMGTKREQSSCMKVVKALQNFRISNVNFGKTYISSNFYVSVNRQISYAKIPIQSRLAELFRLRVYIENGTATVQWTGLLEDNRSSTC